MDKRPWRWRFFHHDLTAGLIIIIVFLVLIAIGNIFKMFDTLSGGNMNEASQATLAAIIYAVPALGLMRMKRWARSLEIFLSILFTFLGLFLIVAGGVLEGIFIVLTHGAVAWYLLSANCRRIFYFDPS
jgi:NADH:ubiquinone oxidoreductase subunit 2 (subunit N)